MDLYLDLLKNILANEEVSVTFPNLKINLEQAVENKCYMLLKRIKQIIEDESLKDEECFQKIEEIVCAFEEFGLGSGARHDFI